MQDSHSRSSANVLSGLHYQAGTSAQGKLVRVTSGSAFDVIVDLRRSSPTFGRWEGRTLDAESHERIWVPAGCAHGFLVLSDTCDFHYKTSAAYRPEYERTLKWSDASLAIQWPLGEGSQPIVSAKDAAASTFGECETLEGLTFKALQET